MKIIYFGTAPFAVPALRVLSPHVSLVVTQPDRPSGRGLRLQPSPVKLVATELGIPVETPEKCRAPEFVDALSAHSPDVFVVAAYGQILSQKLLDVAVRGGINLHGSILPKYRGAAPIQRAILDGESETGVTLMQMDKGMDTGDVIDIVRTPIGLDETYGQLAERLSELGAAQIAAWIDRIGAGTYPRTPQVHELATHAAKVTKDEAALCIERTAAEEYRRFRAFTPSPGPTINTVTGLWRIRDCRESSVQISPGHLEFEEGQWRLGFSQGSLHLIEVQPAGKKAMPMSDVMRGLSLGDSCLVASSPT